MKHLDEAVAELTRVYDDYFLLSDTLRADSERILDDQRSDQVTRRNLIRVSFPMVEAYSSVLRNICRVLKKHSNVSYTKLEMKLLENEKGFDISERLKESIKLAFRVHELDEQPSFGDHNWGNVLSAIEARRRITHPAKADDLLIGDEEWKSVHAGLSWVIRVFTSFFRQVHDKYGSGA